MYEPLFKLAARRHAVVLRQDMLTAGMSTDAIGRRVDSGWLTPIFPGAYAVASAPVERRQRVIAAVLLTPGAAADGRDAADLLGLAPSKNHDDRWSDGEPIHLALPHATRVRVPGIAVRRQLHRATGDVVRRRGIDCLSPTRLAIDMAGRWPRQGVESLVDTALASRQLRIDDLLRRHLQLSRQGRKGVKMLDAIIEQRVDGQHRLANELERAVRRIMVSAGLQEPVHQHCVVLPSGRHRYIDLAYPALMIGIEVDGYRWHAARTAWAADQTRSNELVALGWRLLRVTADVRADPSVFLRQLAALMRADA